MDPHASYLNPSVTYADDAQLYLALQPNNKHLIGALFAGIQELKLWLTKNFLTLNKGKTEVILFRPTDASNCDLGDLTKWVTPCAKKHRLSFQFRSKVG